MAQIDSLTKLPELHMGVDSSKSLMILKHFNWRIRAKEHDGRVSEFVTRKPDSALALGLYDTVTLSAEFVVGPELRDTLLALRYRLEGSLYAALNNKCVIAVGKFSRSGNYALRRYSQDGEGWFTFSDGVQRLTIVYVPYERTHIFDLAMSIKEKVAAEEVLHERIEERDRYRGIAFYYLAFGIVFMSLFASSRQKTEYLYFSLFCLFGSASYFMSTIDIGILYNLESFAGIFCFEFLAIFFCKILLGRDRSRWPLAIMVAALAVCLLPPVRYYYINTMSGKAPIILGIIYVSLYVYTICTVLFYLIQGVGKKQWEAKTIIFVCLVPIILFVFCFIAIIIFVGYKMNNNQGQFASWLPQMINYLSALIVYVYPLSAVYIVGKRNMLTQKTLQEQVDSIGKLSEENLQREKEKQHMLEHRKEELEREVMLRTAEVVSQKEEIERQHDELKVEKKKSDDLLRNILPDEVAAELKAKGHTEAKLFDNVTVLFTDFVNFTMAGEQMTPQALIDELHACFKAFDDITGKYNLEKIKTIGDAYLAVCGLPVADYKHAEKVVSAAKEISDFMQKRVAERGAGSFNIRIGIHSGPVVAGIVGVKKFAYDVWGDTVNTAARLEQKGESGKINISQSTYELVKDVFTCQYRGEIAAKNKGPMKMYFVE